MGDPPAASRRFGPRHKKSPDNNRLFDLSRLQKAGFLPPLGNLIFTQIVQAVFALVGDLIPLRKKEEGAMKALALLTAAAVTLFSVAASAQTYGAPYGKGKAPPPPPVVTKG